MTKRILLLFAFSLLLFTPTIVAQVQPGDTTYHVSLHVGYGHNLTYGSMCNFDIDAYMPINPYF